MAALAMTGVIKGASTEKLYPKIRESFVQGVRLENYPFSTKYLRTNHLRIY